MNHKEQKLVELIACGFLPLDDGLKQSRPIRSFD